jgi:hypothetical protein
MKLYHISAGNSPDDLAVDMETDDNEFMKRVFRLYPYVNVRLQVPITRAAIDAALDREFPLNKDG